MRNDYRHVVQRCHSIDSSGVNRCLRRHLRFAEELFDPFRDEVGRILERKMTRIDQVQLGIGNVPLVRLRPFHSKERIIYSPHNQHSRLVRAEILLPFLIQSHIRLVIVKEVKLNRVIAGPVEKELIDRVRIGTDQVWFFYAVRVLKDRRLFRE